MIEERSNFVLFCAFELVEELFSADSVLLQEHFRVGVGALEAGELMVSGYFSCFSLKLLQAVDFVVKELFYCAVVNTFQLVEDIEDHFELALHEVSLTQHLLELSQRCLAVFVFSFARLKQLLQRFLVLLKRELHVLWVVTLRNVHH